MTEDVLERYKRADMPLPDQMWLWPLYGAGFENLGRDGKPILVPMPSYGPDELLVRHDAVGLCFSDVKVIQAGETHPRLHGRNMQLNPVVLGHEVSLTIVGVGANLEGQFHIGDRFLVQADIYVGGKTTAYGYVLQGGLSQYNVAGREILHGDAGCYLLPIQGDLSYAGVALTEPWACVEAAYHIEYRTAWQNGGVVWLIGAADSSRKEYSLGHPWREGENPRLMIATDAPSALKRQLQMQAVRWGVPLIEIEGPASQAWERALAYTDGTGFDDIVLFGADAEITELALRHLGKGGILNLVAERPMSRPVQVDIGRLHYDRMTIVGTTKPDIARAYQPIRLELKPGGAAWFLGAAGPMGHMHVQRALELPERPRIAVATNLRSQRLSDLEDKLGPLAESRGVKLICMSEEALGTDAFHARLWEIASDGFDDIMVSAPSAKAIENAAPHLARGGVMNIFAGLPRGTIASLDLKPVYSRAVRFVGSSGSSITDMQRMLDKAESSALLPEQAVAAIASLEGAHEGLQAVADGRFPGKVVIYPQIKDLPLTPLDKLAERLPRVYKLLERGRIWTKAAEDELLRELLPD